MKTPDEKLPLKTTLYDGHVITSHRDRYPSDKSWGASHRRKVRWYLRVNELCRLADNHDLLSPS